ncbi:hypothetical protein F5141DRAFT_71953 [Pisolithus sp. B1]|nr:hypothetical protein F5141DRAFT_71953 [Pisolithus sp. B1]
MARFQWENPEQFIGLVNLLSLRNGGQLQPSNGDGERHHNIVVCGEDPAVWEGKEDELKQHFLDGFAEIMSRDKGGKYVSSAVLHLSTGRHPAEGVKASLLVARNGGFRKRDETFCSTLEGLLAAIGASVRGQTNSTLAARRELWKELVCYNQPRLNEGANKLRKHLQMLKASGSLDDIPPYSARVELPQDNDSECRTFYSDCCIGSYSEATHVDHMKLAQKHIFELDTILRTGDKATLAEYSYHICRTTSLWIFLHSCLKVSAARVLLSDIRSLGRLKSCYYMLVNAALNIPGFAQLSIVFVKKLSPRVCPSTLPPVTDITKFLVQTSNPIIVEKLIGGKSSVAEIQRRFEQLQARISRKDLHTHAELQLVFHITKMADVKVMKEIYPFIGCSKLSCFLCTTFLYFFRHRGTAFRTRGSHGKIYTLWSIPDMDELSDDAVTALDSTLKTMSSSLVHEMLKPLTSASRTPIVSAGVTVHNTHSSTLQTLGCHVPG